MGRGFYEKDDMGAHARIYNQILNSFAWIALGYTARSLYVQMRGRLNGSNNGNVEATLAVLRHVGFSSSSTLAKALRELEAVGLISKTRQGGIAAGGKACNLFRFTDKPVHEMAKLGISARGASHDWKQWKSLAHAEAVIREAHAGARRSVRNSDDKAHESNRIDSETEALLRRVSSNFVQVGDCGV